MYKAIQPIKENDLCKILAQYVRIWENQNPDHNIIWCHIPNEGKRSQKEGRNLLRMGLKTGIADYMFVTANQVLFLEVKTDNGQLSKAQTIFKEECFKKGISYLLLKTSDPSKLKNIVWNIMDNFYSSSKDGKK